MNKLSILDWQKSMDSASIVEPVYNYQSSNWLKHYKDIKEYLHISPKVINCFKEDNPVINKKLRKVSVDEGLKIAEELFNILSERKDGIGLAANQVGYDARVAVVNIREPLILINPVITEQWDEIDYYEGCLSYPERGVKTKRYRNVIVQTEQEESGWYFSGVETPGEGKGTWETG